MNYSGILRTRLAAFHHRSAQVRRIVQRLPGVLHRPVARRTDEAPRIRFVYDDIGAPARYRVDHQIEQARIAGFAVHDAPLEGSANPYDLATCDLLYLYRLPLTLRTWPLILTARRMRIPIVFDTDDLVWDVAERQYSYLDAHHSPPVVAAILRTIRRTYATMRHANALVFSTPYLAQLAARSFHQPGYVNANALSHAMVAIADQVYAQRRARLYAPGTIIGYFSGTPGVHEEDLASITPALCSTLDRDTSVLLRIYGGVQISGALADQRYEAQIEQRALVGWRELLHHIAEVDINIAPLIDNPQRRSKSAVKYMEAALVGVPIIATQLDPYQAAIEQGVNGLLASTHTEWVDSLAQLIQLREIRQQIGEAARADVLAKHTTTVRAVNFASIITQVVA
ncbi:MAG: glycosyltransferase [Chloroflexota bacterium]|nr:glycosyltransferase [Chloroflexota bacterium]